MRSRTVTAVYPVAALMTVVLLAIVARPAAAQQVELLSGTPYGVGRVTIRLDAELPGDPWSDGRIDVTESSGRVLYPVYASGPVRRLLREVLGSPSSMTILFLFQGAEPLDLTIYTPRPVTVRATPASARPGYFNNALGAWWRDYSRTAERHVRSADYPPLVDTYLTLTLARRLGLAAPRLDGDGLLRGEADQGLSLLLGTDSVRTRMQQQVLAAPVEPTAAATRAVPALAAAPVSTYPDAPADVRIEPIARHVPAECFYLHCGTFANYVWMRSTMDEWGGDLRNLISQRGLDYQMNARNERQLALKETMLSRTFGGTLISDVAIIGTDAFFREGAAFGILFEARNNLLLGNSIAQQRTEAIAQEAGRATQQEVEIAGQKVKFLSTPGGEVRSYYVVVGNYHLVTTSAALAQRFIEVGRGKGSLGESREFRAARARLPLTREDTLFLYASEAFLRNIASPRYRIEMARRLRSAIEIESVRLARLAAAGEQKPGATIDQLVQADLLPSGFGQRIDGSRLVVEADRVFDSIRGTPGFFVPVPDVKVVNASPDEVVAYEQFVRTMRDSAAHLDPIVAAVKRYRTKTPGQERVRLEAFLTPINGGKYAWLTQFLGEPSNNRVHSPIQELARIEGAGRGGNYLFLGIEDFNAPLNVLNGKVRWGMPTFDSLRGYLGGSPSLGLLDPLIRLVQGRLTSPPDAAGYARYAGGLWQRSSPSMTVVSFNRDLLERVTPGLKLEAAARPAQLRATVSDLSGTKLAAAVNAKGYERARDVSTGNAALLQSLARQLHVPREKCLAVAEDLLAARLVCPLRGKYVLTEEQNHPPTWVSTAWTGANRSAMIEIPADYTAPLMKWFRGLDLEASSRQDTLSLWAEVGLQHQEAGSGFVLPGFLLPSGPKSDGKVPPPPEISPQVEDLPSIEELPPPPDPTPRTATKPS